jgi:hypothetical protein
VADGWGMLEGWTWRLETLRFCAEGSSDIPNASGIGCNVIPKWANVLLASRRGSTVSPGGMGRRTAPSTDAEVAVRRLVKRERPACLESVTTPGRDVDGPPALRAGGAFSYPQSVTQSDRFRFRADVAETHSAGREDESGVLETPGYDIVQAEGFFRL